MATGSLEEQVRALDEGRAAVSTAGWIVVAVSGDDAGRWLHDLVTADVLGLPAGGSVRSLLLTPTGRIRADLFVLRAERGFLLLQPPGQPAAIDDLLAPYVLSSDVELERRSVGMTLAPVDHAWAVAPEGLPVVDDRAADAWRIRRGVPRFPIDLDEGSLPAEAGLDRPPVTDRSKGCFLGQESVAKLANLGHPPRVVLAVEADAAVSPGDPVEATGRPVGLVTSASGSAAIVRVRWEARDADLTTAAGVPLRIRSGDPPPPPRTGGRGAAGPIYYGSGEFSRLFLFGSD